MATEYHMKKHDNYVVNRNPSFIYHSVPPNTITTEQIHNDLVREKLLSHLLLYLAFLQTPQKSIVQLCTTPMYSSNQSAVNSIVTCSHICCQNTEKTTTTENKIKLSEYFEFSHKPSKVANIGIIYCVQNSWDRLAALFIIQNGLHRSYNFIDIHSICLQLQEEAHPVLHIMKRSC